MTKRVFPFAFLLQALLLLRALFISCHREMKMSGVLILHHTIVASKTHTVHIWHSSSFICLPQTLSLMFYCAAVFSAFLSMHLLLFLCLLSSHARSQLFDSISQRSTSPAPHCHSPTSHHPSQTCPAFQFHVRNPPPPLSVFTKRFFNFIDFMFLCSLNTQLVNAEGKRGGKRIITNN